MSTPTDPQQPEETPEPIEFPEAPPAPEAPATPTYQAPTYETPTYEAPTYETPTYQVPTYEAEAAAAPEPPAYQAPPPAYGAQPPAYGSVPPAYPTGPGYAPDAYGTPSYGYAAPNTSKNSLGTWALVLGILGFVCCGPFAAIPAIIVGQNSKRAAEQGLATNGNLGNVGVILGWVALALWAVGLVLNVTTGAFDVVFDQF